MSLIARLNGCLYELQNADYTTEAAARRTDAAVSRLLALVWEGALTGVKFSSSETKDLSSFLADAAGPLRARCARLACIFRTRLEDSFLRERSSIQFLLDGFAGSDVASRLREAGIDESVALLDTVIARFRDDSDSDDSDSEAEPRATQPHDGVPASHTWWSR